MNQPAEGLRERKRRATLQRITEVGIRLFIERGFEATTLDEIAAGAGISRRTFFAYFKSKDDVLLALEGGMGDQIAAAVRAAAPDARPLPAVRAAVVAVCGAVPPADMLVIDRLMRASSAVQARKQAGYLRHEATLLAALRERWPDPAREAGLRAVAMASLGALRLAVEAFGREAGQRPLVALVGEAFDVLVAEVGG